MTFIDRSCRAQVEEKIKPIDRQCSEVRDGTPDSCHSKLLTRLNLTKCIAPRRQARKERFLLISPNLGAFASLRESGCFPILLREIPPKFQCLVSLLSYGRELPVLFRMIESLEKTFFLFFLGNVEKEFSTDHAVARQVAVEITDVLAKRAKSPTPRRENSRVAERSHDLCFEIAGSTDRREHSPREYIITPVNNYESGTQTT